MNLLIATFFFVSIVGAIVDHPAGGGIESGGA